MLHEETLVVEFEPLQAKRSLGKLVRSASDREKLNRVFDSLEAQELDDKQQALLADLRKLVPRPAAAGTAARARKTARPSPMNGDGSGHRRTRRATRSRISQ